MCVFESGSGADSNVGESSSSQEGDRYISESYDTAQSDRRVTLDRNLLFEDESVSSDSQQETQSDDNSEDQFQLLCTATNSAQTSLTSLEATLKTSLSSESEVFLSKNLKHASDFNDEEHFEISPQIPQEPLVFTDEQCHSTADITGAAGSFTSQVMAPNYLCAAPVMPLPLSPKETEEFDEKKSLEAINMVNFASGGSALSSDLQSVDTTPFVKEELKERINLRRKQRGLPSLKLKEEAPKPDILTPAEEEKRRLRRERNRLAAAKCRRKKKVKAQEKKKTSQLIIEQNRALMEEKYELMEEKAKLQAMLRNHLQHCNRVDVVPFEGPEMTSVKINTSSLEISDSDSTGADEALFFSEESLGSDTDSVDITDDVSDQLLDQSLVEAMADDGVVSSASETLQQAVTLLNSIGGDCLSSSGNLEFEYLPPL